MPIMKASQEKVGSHAVMNVDVGLNDEAVFPAFCPCCAEPAEEGATHVAACKDLPPVVFPACKICARHLSLEDKISSVMGPAMVYLSLLTVVGVLFYRGARNTGELGKGWQLMGGVYNLQFPFMGPLNAALTLGGGVAVFLGLLFVYWLVMRPLFWRLSKRSCNWYIQAARTVRRSDPAGGECRRFIFENLDYAAKFIKANSPASHA